MSDAVTITVVMCATLIILSALGTIGKDKNRDNLSVEY